MHERQSSLSVSVQSKRGGNKTVCTCSSPGLIAPQLSLWDSTCLVPSVPFIHAWFKGSNEHQYHSPDTELTSGYEVNNYYWQFWSLQFVPSFLKGSYKKITPTECFFCKILVHHQYHQTKIIKYLKEKKILKKNSVMW